MFRLRLILAVLCFASSAAMAADEKGWFLANSVADRGPGMAGLCSGSFNLVIKQPQEPEDCDGFFDVLFYADLKSRKIYWSKSAAQQVDTSDYKRSVVGVLRGQLQSGGAATLEQMRDFYLGDAGGSGNQQATSKGETETSQRDGQARLFVLAQNWSLAEAEGKCSGHSYWGGKPSPVNVRCFISHNDLTRLNSKLVPPVAVAARTVARDSTDRVGVVYFFRKDIDGQFAIWAYVALAGEFSQKKAEDFYSTLSDSLGLISPELVEGNVARLQGERSKNEQKILADKLKKEQKEKTEAARKETPEYKRRDAANQIKMAQRFIVGGQNAITNEEEIGRVSGYVNKARMHDAGSQVVFYQKMQQAQWKIYKENGGRAQSIAELLKGAE